MTLRSQSVALALPIPPVLNTTKIGAVKTVVTA